MRQAWQNARFESDRDWLAREEPLEIRWAGVPLAVLMRTPGHDAELALGFLLTEGIIASPADVASVHHCTQVDRPEAEDNVVQVVPAKEASVDIERLRRHSYVSSSCGVCGKASLELAMLTAAPLDDRVQVNYRALLSLPQKMLAQQRLFACCGGVHAAGLFTARGDLLVVREDVGRHNAVDKIVGWAASQRKSLAGHLLCVSGRVSFEIVQKALAARIPVLAAVSAPSSLAVELAEAAGITLAGFVRDQRLCVYANTQRLTHD